MRLSDAESKARLAYIVERIKENPKITFQQINASIRGQFKGPGISASTFTKARKLALLNATVEVPKKEEKKNPEVFLDLSRVDDRGLDNDMDIEPVDPDVSISPSGDIKDEEGNTIAYCGV